MITAFRAELDFAALGRPLHALIDIRLRPDTEPAHAEAAIARLPQLIDATHVTGRVDYTLRVACRDPTDLDELITALNRDVGAGETDTRLILRDSSRNRTPNGKRHSQQNRRDGGAMRVSFSAYPRGVWR